jgi:hypothetical protein
MPSVQQKRLQQKKPLKKLPLKLPTMPKLLKTLHLQKLLPMPKLQILTSPHLLHLKMISSTVKLARIA